MQNIDPVYLAGPIVVLAFMVGLVIYWHRRGAFGGQVLLYSLIAYAGAIALKYAVQIPTIHPFESATGGSPFALGIYYGVQTAAFEVGGAYVVARLALSRRRLSPGDAGGFGLGLAFWENAVLFAIPLIINYTSYYVILSAPGSGAAQVIYPILTKDSPSLFFPPSTALPLVGLAVLERVSSLLAHYSWGLLCVLGAAYGRRGYVAAALPVGFVIDFLVPFSPVVGLGVFELAIFMISVASLAGALALTRSDRARSRVGLPEPAPGSNT